MKVDIELDGGCTEPAVIIRTSAVTPEIANLAELLRNTGKVKRQPLIGMLDEKMYLLAPEDIDTFYAENQKIYARGQGRAYLVRQRLYELEAMLAGDGFVRISHSEIVNFRKVKSLDMSISGTITLRMKSGAACFVSRRYVEKIKRHLGL